MQSKSWTETMNELAKELVEIEQQYNDIKYKIMEQMIHPMCMSDCLDLVEINWHEIRKMGTNQ